MPTSYAHYGPTHPVLGAQAERVSRPLLRAYAARYGFHTPDSAYARERGASFAEKLRRGERVYLAGIGPAGHNSGVALVEASRVDGIRLICNNEEERYTGVRHCTTLARAEPARRADHAGQHRDRAGADPRVRRKLGLRHARRHLGSQHRRGTSGEPRLPAAAELRADEREPHRPRVPLAAATRAPTGAASSHADHRHAAPRQPRLFLLCGVAVCRQRRAGDDQRAGRHRRRWRDLALPGARRRGHADPPQSRHLRFAGRLLQHDQLDPGRLDDPQQRGPLHGLRRLGRWRTAHQSVSTASFASCSTSRADGTVRLNRALANWPRSLQARPYTKALHDIIGPPIPLDAMWNPDAVMRVDVASAEVDSQARFDKAAATQLVFEDALFHIVGHLIRTTGSRRLVLTGGTALNAIANMRLLDHSPGPAHLGAAGAERRRRAGRCRVSLRAVERRATWREAASRILLRRGAWRWRDRGCAAQHRARSAGNV